ncbi:ATP-binding protein [Nonomuraea sp. CA-218870]|uniref:ATP-binding protein n=1 Tax=Nonomuraea sp. CA-218870 TaxID=3239998 RepID=UPI003D8E1120
MTTPGVEALAALSFHYTEGADDVWRPSPFHVEGLHGHSAKFLLDGLSEARSREGASPIGVVVRGQRGTGKTHLLGWLREVTQREGGYFVLVGLLDAKEFWESVMVSLLDSFSRPGEDEQTQLRVFLSRLASRADLSRMARRAVTGKKALSRAELDAFVHALRRMDEVVGRGCQDTARALVLYASPDPALQDLGEAFLYAMPEGEPGERARWGIRPVNKTPQEIVRDVSHLLALTGPTIIAVDQIDPLIAQSRTSTDAAADDGHGDRLLLERIAGGLMALREVTRRTMTVVSCIPATWTLIEREAVDTVRDRFRTAVQLMTIPDAETARELVARRFEVQYREAGAEPPYPTWPVRPEAFDGAPGFTARQLLITIDAHVRACLLSGEVTELTSLTAPAPTAAGGAGTEPDAAGERREAAPDSALDARFATLLEVGETPQIDQSTEDVLLPPLLAAGLSAWIAEQGERGRTFSVDPPPSAKPPLHARLRRTLDETTEDEEHWAFRAVTAGHAVAALNRIRKASVAAGLDAEVPKRRLFLLRNGDWSKGARTREVVAAFERAGGRTLTFTGEDLRVLAALRRLLAENPPGLASWLASRRPTRTVSFLVEALTDLPGPATEAPRERAAASEPVPGEALGSDERPDGSYVPLGRTVDGGRPVGVALEALRKHTAIFAGSGSGKTVLIRRLVEECALRGVSAIVLDPNNDLARLGDRWPERPEGWVDGDERRAADYLAGTEVVVWTPRRAAGRPLSFQPLPDFAGVTGDPDEFTEAVESAVASIAPRAKLDARTDKAHLGRAVLRKALEHYGRGGGATLKGLIALLADLPDGVSELAGAPRVAADVARSLQAAMDNDPLFGGGGEPVDPGRLLTPSPGRRARVSVISFVGLPNDDQRQSFVSQLQMALFAWIRKNPAGDRPLGGLLVMDEAQTFAPGSGRMTACTHSTLALASQARKYGLGLVFATQAPKGLHNQIPGNAATQFFGLLNAPVHIEAAKEMARAKGGSAPEISRLGAGEFYVALEGSAFVKARMPMCLSHHPRAPLTTEEVLARAAR